MQVEKLKPGSYYHIYHRGIGRKKIFWGEGDYKRFLKKYFYYLYPCAETYTFCLLNNHIHVLIRVRTQKEQEKLFYNLKRNSFDREFHGLEYSDFKFYRPQWQLGHLFNSHTKYINTSHTRSGVLFNGRFKRKEIESDLYLSHLICYIHRNPVHHRICEDYADYTHSSFHVFLNKNSTLLERDKVFKILGGRKNFLQAHQEFKDLLGPDFLLE